MKQTTTTDTILKEFEMKIIRDFGKREVKKHLEDLTSKIREQTIEEVRKELYNGATRDEVHRRLDVLQEKKEEHE